MDVAELISILQKLPQSARVVLGDPTASEPGSVYSLRSDDISHLELGSTESGGVLLVEIWTTNYPIDGPFDGVLIGTLCE